MPSVKLTKKSIAKLRAPDPSGRQVLYFDTSIRGFGLLCSGVTNAKTYIVQRAIHGRTRRITIGAANTLSLAEAKSRAAEVINQFRIGIDPKARQRGQATLRAARELYLENSHLRARTAASYDDLVSRHLQSWLDLPLRSVTPDMVKDQHKKIAAGVASGGQYSGNATANAAMRAFRLLYNFAADRADHSDPLPPNPVKRGIWLKVERRTSRIANADLAAFYAAVTKLENTVARDYITLLLLTGMRRRECAALRWKEDVDLKSGFIHLGPAATKSGKPLDLPMSSQVRELLESRRRIGDAKFVFPAISASGHIEEPRFALRQVEKLSGVSISVHDLRRTFISIAESCGTQF
jgi:integrase